MWTDSIFDRIIRLKTAIHNQAVNELKDRWQDQFEENAKKAALAARHFGGEEFSFYLDWSGLGDEPRFVEFCYRIYEALAAIDLDMSGADEGGMMPPINNLKH